MPVDEAERRARMLLSRVVEPGDVDAAALVAEHGAVALLGRLRERDAASGKPAAWAARLAAASESAILSSAESVRARYACPGDVEWPTGLDDLIRLRGGGGDRRGAAPLGLWLRGTGRLDRVVVSVSVVGARASTAYGDHVAGELAYRCGARGLVVVSGGAYGIDAAAHRGALAGDYSTVAVLAGGVDRLYPAGNAQLLREAMDGGVVVAEAGPGCAPSRSRFLVRNRLIAALGSGTVVVEAAVRSGALSTARWALDLGRPVMGVPGPVTSMMSGGVHELLRQPGPLLVTDADEVIEHVSTVGANLAPRKTGPSTLLDALDGPLRQVLEAVPSHRPAGAASIARVAGLPADRVTSILEALVTVGLVEAGPNGWVRG